MRCIPLFLLSCEDEVVVPVPLFDATVERAGMAPLSPETLGAMEGIYEVIDEQSLLGREAVVKWTGRTVSIFTDREAGYCVLESGSADSSILFAGCWRKLTGTETGILRMRIDAARGGRGVLAGTAPDSGDVVILGDFGNAGGEAMRPLLMGYRRPLYQGPRPSLILAHRAGDAIRTICRPR